MVMILAIACATAITLVATFLWKVGSQGGSLWPAMLVSLVGGLMWFAVGIGIERRRQMRMSRGVKHLIILALAATLFTGFVPAEAGEGKGGSVEEEKSFKIQELEERIEFWKRRIEISKQNLSIICSRKPSAYEDYRRYLYEVREYNAAVQEYREEFARDNPGSQYGDALAQYWPKIKPCEQKRNAAP